VAEPTDEQPDRERLLRVLREDLLPRMTQSGGLLLVGSYAEGNANSFSDVDLIAIAPQGRGPRFTAEQAFEVRGLRVVVNHRTERQLRGAIRSLDDVYRSGGHVSEGIATRLAHAVIVDDPFGIAARLVAQARGFRPRVETYQEMGTVLLSFYEDALGSLRAGDPATAVVMARQAATVAIDCLLLQQGIRSLKPKWHLRRLNQVGADAALSRYRQILGLDDLDEVRAAITVAHLDRLICEVLQVSAVREFHASPLFVADPAATTIEPGDPGSAR
jgi:hypothetical protein